MIGQQLIDRPLPQPITEELPRVLEPLLHNRHTQRHPKFCFREAANGGCSAD